MEMCMNTSEYERGNFLEKFEQRLEEERRKHARKPFFMAVDYATKDKTYKDFIQNISTGGVFIETRMPLYAGQKLAMSFPLPNCKKHVKITGKIVRQDVAMTGEITLRGDVLPVGGIGEKVLAALRADIKELVLPALNEKDVMEIPDDVREGVIFHYVNTISEVLSITLEKEVAN